MSLMKRGEVWWVSFDPSVGGEIQKRVPLTRNVDRLYPSEAYVTLNGQQRKAMADQLTTVSKQRLQTLTGTLATPDPERVATPFCCSWPSRRPLTGASLIDLVVDASVTFKGSFLTQSREEPRWP